MKKFYEREDVKVKVATRNVTVDDLPSVGLLMVLLIAVLLISGVASGI
jgi:hypothetical protein